MRFFRAVRLNPILRHTISLVFDLIVAAVAFAAAYLTAHGYPAILWYIPALTPKLLWFLVVSLVAFLIFEPYKSSWRYVSVPDLFRIVKGAALAVVIYTVGSFLLTRGYNLPRSVPILTFIYMVMIFTGARLSYRMLAERTMYPTEKAPVDGERRTVLLCGFSDKAESFLRNARRSGNFFVVGILDSTITTVGKTIQGVSVVGRVRDLDAILERLKRNGVQVDELIVTEMHPSRDRLAYILGMANANQLRVSLIPDFDQMATAATDFLSAPKPIEIEDLLERPEVKADLQRVACFVEGRVVMTTGAGGSIGSELCRQIAALKPRRLIISDSSEFLLYTLDTDLRSQHPDLDIVTRILDVREEARVRQLVAEWRPEIIFHAAALKHVPMMEENPLEAIKTNILGTRNVADAALENRVSSFVMISTDKAVKPTSVMGATKRAAEAYCQALDKQSEETHFKTVRFGNVLGSNGSVVPRFREQIAAGGPVTVTHSEIVRYFMTIPEAVRLVLHASAHEVSNAAARGKIMVLDMGKPVKIVDLAERMIQLAGFRPHVDIDITFTGLRPGEKLYEELFDPSEVPDGRTEEGYVVAAPRIIDRRRLDRAMADIAACTQGEDAARALHLLEQIVPEYKRGALAEAGKAVPQPGKAVASAR